MNKQHLTTLWIANKELNIYETLFSKKRKAVLFNVFSHQPHKLPVKPNPTVHDHWIAIRQISLYIIQIFVIIIIQSLRKILYTNSNPILPHFLIAFTGASRAVSITDWPLRTTWTRCGRRSRVASIASSDYQKVCWILYLF